MPVTRTPATVAVSAPARGAPGGRTREGLGWAQRSGRRGGVGRSAGGALTACGPPGASEGSPETSSPAGPSAAPAESVPPGAVPVESNPPGDIPDTVAYVAYADSAGGFRFRHPEGWAQTAVAGGVRFADKLNSVTVTSAAGSAPSVTDVRTRLVPDLEEPGVAFQLESVDPARLPAGSAVKVVWRRNSAPDAVTGRVYRDEVVTYLVGAGGRALRMDLSGPVGADNVDPYKTMSDSLAAA